MQGYLTSGVILSVKLMQKSYVKEYIYIYTCGFLFLHARRPVQWLVQLSWWDQPETLSGSVLPPLPPHNPGKDEFCFIGQRAAVSSD